MIRLTTPGGAPVTIDGRHVVRARRRIHGEPPEAGTRIDKGEALFVREPIGTVAPLVQAEQPKTFVSVTSRDGSKIWFDGSKARGPVTLAAHHLDGVVRSALVLMNYRQYVTETPEQVRAIIAGAGGIVEPADPGA